ncbi:hypothetical protein ABHC39_05210 [Pediococcus acidilactici]|uniref:hypothetical protein n=1 Tax=Pediococcus acidilactici TaxID=1254 RepID=UPI00232CDEFB|nr:hypothetical protein [Pediococcus acidilactici]MDB8867669.1 hypothetical protein [Pediococcus acidilactici]
MIRKIKYIVENKTWIVAYKTFLKPNDLEEIRYNLKKELQLRDNERLIILSNTEIA